MHLSPHQSGALTRELLIDKSPPLPLKFGDLPHERGEFHLQKRNMREATPPHKHRVTDAQPAASGEGGSAARYAAQRVFYQPGNGNGVADAMRHHVLVDPGPTPPPAQTTYSTAIHAPPSFVPETARQFRSVGSSLGFPEYQGPPYAKDWTHRAHDLTLRSPRSIPHALRAVADSTGALQQKIAEIALEPRAGLNHVQPSTFLSPPPLSARSAYSSSSTSPAAAGVASGAYSARLYGTQRGGAPTVITTAAQAAMSWDPISPTHPRNASVGGGGHSAAGHYSSTGMHSARGGGSGSASARSGLYGEGAPPPPLLPQPPPPQLASSDDILRNFKLRQKIVKEMRLASDRGIGVQESAEQAFLFNVSQGVYRK